MYICKLTLGSAHNIERHEQVYLPGLKNIGHSFCFLGNRKSTDAELQQFWKIKCEIAGANSGIEVEQVNKEAMNS